MKELIFVIFLLLTVLPAFIVAFSKNLIYSVFSLMATFLGVAGLYIFLMADFLAVAQVMVYVGGILVLLIFGVMLTQKITSVIINHQSLNRIWAILLGAALLAIMAYVIYSTSWFAGDPVLQKGTINEIGHLLMTKYLLAFEAISVLLLGALIGAATIARGESR